MRRLFGVAALALAACTTTPPATPKVDATGPVLAALREPRDGRWTMEIRNGPRTERLDVEDTWTPVGEESGRARFDLHSVARYADGTRLASRLAYAIDAEGLWQVGAQVGPTDEYVAFDPPLLVLPAGAELGTRWFATPPTSGETSKACELRTTVRCEVGVVVDCTSPARDGTLRRREHLCADVPWFAIETRITDGRGELVTEAVPVDAPSTARAASPDR